MSDLSDVIHIDPLINAAYLAGRGATAEEIAQAVGAHSAETLTAALRLYNIRLEAKPFGLRTVVVRITPAALAKYEAAAVARGIETAELINRVVGMVGREISIDALLDDRKGGA